MMPVVFDGEPAPGLSCVSASTTGLLAPRRNADRVRDRFGDPLHALRGKLRLGCITASARRLTARSHRRLIGPISEHGGTAVRDVRRRKAGREVEMHAGLGLDCFEEL